MKQLFNISLAFIFLVLSGFVQELEASHLMGGDIAYKSLGGDKYRFTAKIYRDCRGIPFNSPTIMTRCVQGGSQSANISGTLISIRDITPTCKSVGIKCDPQNQTISSSDPAIEEHTYEFDMNFSSWRSSGCCIAEVGIGQCCRNGAITTGGSGNDFWVKAEINLCLKNRNNSPVFYTEAKSVLQCNQAVYYNAGAVDYLDNDSLVYEMTDPLTNWSTKINWTGGISAQQPFSVYCVGSCNPALPGFYPPRGFYLNSQTGDMVFTPTDCNQTTVYAIKVTEYRKDSTGKYIKVGYVVRDHQVSVMNMAGNNTPIIDGPSNIYIPDSSETIINYNTIDNIVKGSTVINNDTVKLKMVLGPNGVNDSTFTVNNPKARNPNGTFKWKPSGKARSLPYLLLMEARDNACNFNAMSQKAVNIYVRKKSELAWVEGTVYFDANINCKRDSNERTIPYAWVTADNGVSINFRADSTGRFSGWYPAGNVTLRVAGTFSSFVCNSTLSLTSGKTNTVELGGTNRQMYLSGTVYYDSIKNCKNDNLDPKGNENLVYTEPGGFAASTDSKGAWNMIVPAGNYTILCKIPEYASLICPSTPLKASIYTDTLFKNLDMGLFDTLDVVDLSTYIITRQDYRIGNSIGTSLIVKNNGTKTISNARVWIKFNKNLKMTSSSSYLAKTDTTLLFSVPSLKRKESTSFHIGLYVDPKKCKLNDKLTFNAWLDTNSLSKDRNKGNNTDTRISYVTAAVDPNIKQELNTNGFAWREGNRMRYHIEFQNTGNDSAVNIVVIDTLPYTLVTKSFSFLGSSHKAVYNLNNNVLTVKFPNIYLPDSSTNKEESTGHFEFSIDIDPLITKETRFYNRVYIYFDFAAPVLTNKNYITYTSYVKAGQTNKINYCQADTIRLNYNSNFTFNSGNKFKLVLSDKNGNFTSGTKIIDSISSVKSSGTFKYKITSGIPEGDFYRFKVISSSPVSHILSDGVSNYFKINGQYTPPVLQTKDSLYCGKDSIAMTLNSQNIWVKIYDNNKKIDSLWNKKSFKLKLLPGKHTLTATYTINGACHYASDTLRVKTDTLPRAKLTSVSHPSLKICANDTVTLSVTGSKKFDLLGNSLVYINSYTSSPFKVIIPQNNDSRTIRAYSALGCTDTSNTLKFTRYNNPITGLTISDPDFEVCKGTNIVFTGSGGNTYQLFKNDIAWLPSFTTNISSSDFITSDKIRVYGKDNNNCSSFSSPLSIKVNPPPKVNFMANDVCDHDSVSFVNQTPDTSSFTWKFGDSKVSGLSSPKHLYTILVTTTFNVRLLAKTNKGCSDSITKAVTINLNPGADFTFTVSGNTVNFKANQIGNPKYIWYLGTGDSISSSASTSNYTYPASPDGKKVCLKVINLANCSSQTCQVIKSGGTSPIIENKFRIYPNPNTGIFTLEQESPEGEVKLELINAMGQIIYKETFLDAFHTVYLNQPNGIYMLRLSQNDKTFRYRIIIQH